MIDGAVIHMLHHILGDIHILFRDNRIHDFLILNCFFKSVNCFPFLLFVGHG